ncbi:hypothetical protein PENANT_c006G03515 [Penicillium antarcticum]|uniref:Uncharacterized protein n=1 Tax=Penicillium antarcticum TaxID=416450 RepID=A0A1V6QDF4_9EURO|nr:uncharacterized protein N7508_009455 [Penicillium antarcticum]KAJ5294634.1 hypothetical protein N7508_009455 [Penicillium antarcticum]OQD87233.1 hypothetical protein PENANT_c006G03515 [Penicillium antarcticum]
MVKTESTLPSPPSESASASAVPLDSPMRATPIHSDLSEIKVPDGDLPSYRYHPVTCQPMEIRDYKSELAKLEREYPSREGAARAQDETVKEVRSKIESAKQKRAEVQKAIDKKVKERNTEMKVVSKFQEVKASDIPS